MVLSSGTSEFKSSGVTTTPGGSLYDIQYHGGSDGFSGNGSLTFNGVQLKLNGSMTINGNLQINGSYTDLHHENLTIKDKLFAMNASATQPNSASNSGIIIYDVPNASNVFFGLNNDRVFAIASASGVTANDNTTLNGINLEYNIDLRGNNASFTNISASGTLNVTGNASFTNASFTNISASGTLDVTGNASFTNISASGTLNVTGDITAFYSSDKRLKENIKKIENPLDKLENINGYTFDWIEKEGIHSNKGHDIGVIAQEIEEVLPEVTTTRDNGYKAVRYEKIVPLLIECIKEQQKQIDELKEEIILLKKKKNLI